LSALDFFEAFLSEAIARDVFGESCSSAVW
jgi:hypothetical protein